MTKGQWTVTGLLVFLALLEAGRSATVRAWFTSVFSSLNSGISQVSNKPTGATGTNKSGQCPPGKKWVVLAGGTTGVCM